MNIPKCIETVSRAQKFIPGVTQLLSKRPDQFSLGVWPSYFDRARGSKIWDLDGNEYIDMSIGGVGANILGYSDPDINAKVMEALQKGISCTLNCYEEVELAELLCSLHPWAQQVRYSRTGGEAMAIAIRIARAHSKKDIIAFCGYHGWHDWYLAANLKDSTNLDQHLLKGLSPAGVPKQLTGTTIPFIYNNPESLKKISIKHRENLAAIVMEPRRGELPTQNFIDTIHEIANSNNIVLIIDEISAGFRTNTGGAHLELGINPDIAVFSKAIGNGHPISAIIGKRQVMKAAEKSFISSVNWTERIGPTAALATIKKFRKYDVSKHLIKIGSSIQDGLKQISEKYHLKIEISGIEPMGHFTFTEVNHSLYKALFVQLMLEHGILASNAFYAMYAHTSEDVEKYLKAAEESFCFMSKFKNESDIKKLLKGAPSNPGFQRLVQ